MPGATQIFLMSDGEPNYGIVDSGPLRAFIRAHNPHHIVISTFAETKSGWLRTDLIERVRRASGKPVEHVVQRDPETANA